MVSNLATKQVARLLRISEAVVLDLEEKMNKISGKKGIIEKIANENNQEVSKRLKELIKKQKHDAKKGLTARQVYRFLIGKAKETDKALYDHFYKPDISTIAGCRSLVNAIRELTGDLPGFYLKREKAKQLLKLNPPRRIMASLGYGDDIDKMCAKEDIFELFCALRFVEDSRWLNSVFFKPYHDLKENDFEEREIQVMALPARWEKIGKEFAGKKLHHMSHLKELGIAFIIPVEEQFTGEALYLFFMILHYIYEVDWHARLFKTYSKKKDFARQMINALKVEVTGIPLPNTKKMSWRIVPKYLAKHDPNDPRLAEPHISPEAWHYTRAMKAIQKCADRFPELELDFWHGLGESGEYFPSGEPGDETLISFDLFDNGIALLRQAGFESKYLYHQQEALWNKIFIEYMGEKELDRIMMKNLTKGYVTLPLK